jgi:hypothetical protein
LDLWPSAYFERHDSLESQPLNVLSRAKRATKEVGICLAVDEAYNGEEQGPWSGPGEARKLRRDLSHPV